MLNKEASISIDCPQIESASWDLKLRRDLTDSEIVEWARLSYAFTNVVFTHREDPWEWKLEKNGFPTKSLSRFQNSFIVVFRVKKHFTQCGKSAICALSPKKSFITHHRKFLCLPPARLCACALMVLKHSQLSFHAHFLFGLSSHRVLVVGH